MICCKIITDYSNKQASFSKLCEFLSKKGEWFWQDGNMYFADTTGPTTEKQVANAVKKAGYSKNYIQVFDTQEEPHEEDTVKWWIVSKLAHIMKNTYEKENQKLLQDTKKCLEEINHRLDEKIKNAVNKTTVSDETEEQE